MTSSLDFDDDIDPERRGRKMLRAPRSSNPWRRARGKSFGWPPRFDARLAKTRRIPLKSYNGLKCPLARASILVILLAVGATSCKRPSPGAGAGSPQPPAEQSGAATPETDPVPAALEAVKAQPNFETYTALGLAYSQTNRHEEALAAFQRSLGINPRSALAYNNICAEKNALRDWAEAIRNCKKALEIQPDFTYAKGNLTVAESSRAAESKVIAEIQRAIAAGKDVDANRIELGLAHYRRGANDEAIAAWKAVGPKSPQYAVAQNDIASIYIVQKKFDLAQKALDNALRIDPENQLYKNNLEWLRSEMKRK
jgi:Flp pilus assembly protein TadD